MHCNAGYDWCKDRKVVYKDGDKHFCVFHAPEGRKGVGLDEFNKLIFSEIEKAEGENKVCDLSGTIFEGDISFSGREIKTSILFIKAQFSRKADFSYARFRKKSYFSMAKFRKADFRNAQFSGESVFFGTEFGGEANFLRAQFSENVDFSAAKFTEDAHFTGTQFSGNTYFIVAKFMGEVYFSEARFSRDAGFRLAKFSGKAKFTGNTFEGEVQFRDLIINGTLVFQNVNLKNAYFLVTDLRHIDFISCKWNEKGGRYVLKEEIELFKEVENSKILLRLLKFLLRRWRKPRQLWRKRRLLWKKLSKNMPPLDRIENIENLYRLLKINAKEMHNEFDVSRWHHSEKEMLRKRTGFYKDPFNWLVLNLYYCSSGYGENPFKAGVMLFLIIAILFFGLSFLGLEPIGVDIEPFSWRSLSSLWKSFLSLLEILLFRAPTYYRPSTIWSVTLKVFAQILVPIQAAFFALALRNRFRRT